MRMKNGRRVGKVRISRGAKLDEAVLMHIDVISVRLGLSRNCILETVLRIGLEDPQIERKIIIMNMRDN